jgi:hypothetical protein
MATKAIVWIRSGEAFLEHATAVFVGFVMMVVGLAMGVTMVMLPLGVVVGLVGVAIFVGGLFSHPSNE